MLRRNYLANFIENAWRHLFAPAPRSSRQMGRRHLAAMAVYCNDAGSLLAIPGSRDLGGFPSPHRQGINEKEDGENATAGGRAGNLHGRVPVLRGGEGDQAAVRGGLLRMPRRGPARALRPARMTKEGRGPPRLSPFRFSVPRHDPPFWQRPRVGRVSAR